MGIAMTDDQVPDSLTAQGRRTRAALVAAAERVFVRHGFIKARIGDVTREAGVAVGSFYTYFPSKEAIFVAVVDEYRRRLRAHLAGPGYVATDPIRTLNRRYMEFFAANPRMWAAMEEAALSMPELRAPVAEARHEFTDVARGVIAGRARDDVAVRALALTAMTEQWAAQRFAEPGEPGEPAAEADRLSDMWIQMLEGSR
jgi:AcrR family transcriptional regulator